MLKRFLEYNESVRDKMTPKSEAEVDKAFDIISNDIADICIDQYEEEFDDWMEAYDWAAKHKEKIIQMLNDDTDLEDIVETILYGWK